MLLLSKVIEFVFWPAPWPSPRPPPQLALFSDWLRSREEAKEQEVLIGLDSKSRPGQGGD